MENILLDINEKIKNFNRFLFFTFIIFMIYTIYILLFKDNIYLNIFLLILFITNLINLYKATLDYTLRQKNEIITIFKIYILLIATPKKGPKKHYALKTCQNYIDAIDKCSKLLNINIWNEQDFNEIDTFLNKLKRDKTFLSLNSKGNNMYSNGLERYKEFLEFINKGR